MYMNIKLVLVWPGGAKWCARIPDAREAVLCSFHIGRKPESHKRRVLGLHHHAPRHWSLQLSKIQLPKSNLLDRRSRISGRGPRAASIQHPPRLINGPRYSIGRGGECALFSGLCHMHSPLFPNKAVTTLEQMNRKPCAERAPPPLPAPRRRDSGTRRVPGPRAPLPSLALPLLRCPSS